MIKNSHLEFPFFVQTYRGGLGPRDETRATDSALNISSLNEFNCFQESYHDKSGNGCWNDLVILKPL